MSTMVAAGWVYLVLAATIVFGLFVHAQVVRIRFFYGKEARFTIAAGILAIFGCMFLFI